MSIKKSVSISFLLTLFALCSYAQNDAKYFTKEGHISFHSETQIETIEADNHKAVSIFDLNGNIEFKVLIKAFSFEKALMQEHFNENYMESNTYPKALFKGQIVDGYPVDFSKDGTYEIMVEGEITIHGISKPIEVPGKITVQNGEISATSVFELTVADFDIKIPAVVRENIAKTVEVSLELEYERLKS